MQEAKFAIIFKSNHFDTCRYFQAGGSPEQVIDLLSKNYHAYAQMANLMAEWIMSAGMRDETVFFKHWFSSYLESIWISTGANINEVRTMVESSLRDMIIKTFDPKKADTIFSEEGEVIFIINIP